MTNPIDKNTSDKKRSHSSQQMPREVRLKRSESDTSLNIQNPIDLYRQTLQREGCVEIDIPLDLQGKIDVVNAILANNKLNNITDYKKGEYKKIKSLCKDIENLCQGVLTSIFPDKRISVIEEEKVELSSRTRNDINNVFHKDYKKYFSFTKTTNFTILLPMLGQQGTLYVPHQHKHQYPENNSHSQEQYKGYVFPKKTIKKEHIQQANPKKIFMFLCRRASEELGEDFDDKSLIHTVPDSDYTANPRLYISGRFGVVDTQDNNPPSQS